MVIFTGSWMVWQKWLHTERRFVRNVKSKVLSVSWLTQYSLLSNTVLCYSCFVAVHIYIFDKYVYVPTVPWRSWCCLLWPLILYSQKYFVLYQHCPHSYPQFSVISSLFFHSRVLTQCVEIVGLTVGCPIKDSSSKSINPISLFLNTKKYSDFRFPTQARQTCLFLSYPHN